MRTSKSTRRLVAAATLAMLGGCGSDMRGLQSYIDSVKLRPGGRIEPLPEIRPAPTFTYEAAGRRSPFMPDTPQQRVSDNPDAVHGPDPDRPREFLEQFPLDTLRMVGTLNTPEAMFGLVQTSDGLIHRVTVGNHLGQNYGRITSIMPSEIRLIEIIPDGLAGFIERPAGLALTE